MALLGACMALLFISQNFYQASGGEISAAKLLWLWYALVAWFVVPAFLACDSRISQAYRRLSLAFLANMLIRAAAELWLMYVTVSWNPYYGICHDLFSMLLILLLLRGMPPLCALDEAVRRWFCIVPFMFGFEIYFAAYMKIVVQQQRGADLYFVPNVPEYHQVLFATWLALFMLTPCLLLFLHRWLYAET